MHVHMFNERKRAIRARFLTHLCVINNIRIEAVVTEQNQISVQVEILYGRFYIISAERSLANGNKPNVALCYSTTFSQRQLSVLGALSNDYDVFKYRLLGTLFSSFRKHSTFK